MFAALLLVCSVLPRGIVGEPPHQTACYVIDFAPVGNLGKSPITHWVTFLGKTADDKRIDFSAKFRADKTPTEVRDIAFDVAQTARLGVKKVGETKLLVTGCKALSLTTEMPPKREFPPNCRPTLDSFKSEAEALKKKD